MLVTAAAARAQPIPSPAVTGRPEAVRETTSLQAAVQRHPDDRVAVLALAKVLEETGDRGAAIALLGDFLRRHPDDADAHLLLARAYARNHDFAAAEIQYQAVLQQRPHAADAQRGLAEAYAVAERFEEARALYAALLADNPGDYDARVGLAAIEAYEGRYSAARADYRRAIALRPDDPQTLVDLARIEFLFGDYGAARRLLNHAMTLDPIDQDALQLKKRIDEILGPALESSFSTLSAGRTLSAQARITQRWFATPALRLDLELSRFDLEESGIDAHANRYGVIATFEPNHAVGADVRLLRSHFVGLEPTTDVRMAVLGSSNGLRFALGYSVGGIDDGLAASDQIISPRGAGIRIASLHASGSASVRNETAFVGLHSAAYSDGNRYHEVDFDLGHQFAHYAGGAVSVTAAARLAGFLDNYSFFAYSVHGYYDYFSERDLSLTASAQARLAPRVIGGVSVTGGTRRTLLLPGPTGERPFSRLDPYLQVGGRAFTLDVAGEAARYGGSYFVRSYDTSSLQFRLAYHW